MTDSDTLSHLSVASLLDRLASSDPVPGGGSAAAWAGAMGAALVGMVAELTIGRPEYAEHDAALREIRASAGEYRQRLLHLAEEDAAAYETVVRARRLPRATDEERATRTAAVRAAMLAAATAPLETARTAVEVVELAERMVPLGNPVAVSDAGVAAQLARASVRGAVLNVQINLPYLAPDEPLRTTAPAELERLEEAAAGHEVAALAAVAAGMRSA